MTKVKVDGSQKYKSGTIKFVPKDVFVLHGRTKAKVADQSQSNTEWFNLPDKVWGNIAATYETADGDDYYSGTNSSNSFGRFAGTVDAANYIKALSTAETTYTQNWEDATIPEIKQLLLRTLYIFMCCLIIRQERPENKKIRKRKIKLSSWIKQLWHPNWLSVVKFI